MKTFIAFLVSIFLMTPIVNCTQSYNKSKILGAFHVGYDTENVVRQNISAENQIVFEMHDNENVVKIIRFEGFVYKSHSCNVEVLLVNNTLHSVTYYPRRDKDVAKYIEFLNKNFDKNWMYSDSNSAWDNNTVLITLNLDPKYEEYFCHYSKEMLTKYPQYKYLKL